MRLLERTYEGVVELTGPSLEVDRKRAEDAIRGVKRDYGSIQNYRGLWIVAGTLGGQDPKTAQRTRIYNQFCEAGVREGRIRVIGGEDTMDKVREIVSLSESEGMKLEDQVVNLEISKRLKNLGVKQESYFVWVETPVITPPQWELMKATDLQNAYQGQNFFSAFTVAELLELLPSELSKGGWEKWDNRFELAAHAGKKWLARYYAGDAFDKGVVAKTPADACAGMLVDLIENNLLTV